MRRKLQIPSVQAPELLDILDFRFKIADQQFQSLVIIGCLVFLWSLDVGRLELFPPLFATAIMDFSRTLRRAFGPFFRAKSAQN